MAGRPRHYNSSEELQEKIDEYFTFIEGEYSWIADSDDEGNPIDKQVWTRKPEPPTITGLALFLGFESRQSIFDYEKNGEFSYTIKTARLRVENNYEKYLISGDSPTGAIFALKNFGWSDRVTQDTNMKVTGIKPIEWVKTKNVEDK